jgi:hypothetical protein
MKMLEGLSDVDRKVDSTAFLYLFAGTFAALHHRHVLLRLRVEPSLPTPTA